MLLATKKSVCTQARARAFVFVKRAFPLKQMQKLRGKIWSQNLFFFRFSTKLTERCKIRSPAALWFEQIQMSNANFFCSSLQDVSARCGRTFERANISTAERDFLYRSFDRFLRVQINVSGDIDAQTIDDTIILFFCCFQPITKAADAFLPLLKEASALARDSVRACAIFSQYSREFAQQLCSPNADADWERCAYRIDDLQARFSEHSIARHWLPSSLTPLLRALVDVARRQRDELTKRGERRERRR